MRERLIALGLVLVVALGLSVAPAAAQGTYYQEVTFDSGKVLTADATSSVFTGFSQATLAGFQITCTEDSGTATEDITIQRSVDQGATWAAIVTFTQLSATGTQTLLYADLRAASAQMIGNRLRVNYDITGAGQYTCSTYGVFEA